MLVMISQVLTNFTKEDLLLRVLNHIGFHDNSIFLLQVRIACIKDSWLRVV